MPRVTKPISSLLVTQLHSSSSSFFQGQIMTVSPESISPLVSLTSTRAPESGWFPAGILPVRVGVYKRVTSVEWSTIPVVGYSYWNGDFWGLGSADPDRAASGPYSNYASAEQNLPWAGITHEEYELQAELIRKQAKADWPDAPQQEV